MSNTTYCKYCNKLIEFVTTSKGRKLPADLPRIDYVEDERGRNKVVTTDGRIETGWILSNPIENSKKGYNVHFVSCKGYVRAIDKKQASTPPKESLQMSLFS